MSERWHVVSQNQSVTLLPGAAGFQDIWEVNFQIDSGPATGQVAMVNVPAETYTPENVAAQVQARVDTMTAIASL